MYFCFSIVLKSHFIRFFSVMICVMSVSPVTLILHVFCFTNINIICELVGSDNSSTTTTPYILLTTHKQTTPMPQNNCNCVCPTYSAVENCPSSKTQSKQLTDLTFSTLGKISAEDILKLVSHFSQKTEFDISCKLSSIYWRQFARTVKTCCKRKNIFNVKSAE